MDGLTAEDRVQAIYDLLYLVTDDGNEVYDEDKERSEDIIEMVAEIIPFFPPGPGQSPRWKPSRRSSRSTPIDPHGRA